MLIGVNAEMNAPFLVIEIKVRMNSQCLDFRGVAIAKKPKAMHFRLFEAGRQKSILNSTL